MTRTLFGLTLLLASAPAHAGLGTTLGLGNGVSALASFDFTSSNPFGIGTASGFLPSLDYRANNLVLQFHVLETLINLTDEDIFLGANIYYNVHRAEIAGPWGAVVQPGGGLDIGDQSNDFNLALTGECRIGMESQAGATFGVYVVPAVGIGIDDDDADLIATGTLQIGTAF